MILLLYSFILISLYPLDTEAKEVSIQEQIDAANPGDEINIAQGTYNVNLLITKPITLIGSDKVIFTSNDQKPIISLKANDVTIENITLNYDSNESESTAMLVTGNNNIFKNLEIKTRTFGIKLDHANDNELSEIQVTGQESNPISERQHGIDLWQSDNNEIHQTTIKHVRDGIYLESSNRTKIHHNDISKSRYGYHLMFTEETKLVGNKSSENISGMMVMGTKGTEVSYNILEYNQGNVQSLGLLLFDVKDATVKHNEILHNRIGVFLESASDNNISMNEVRGNYLGLEFERAEDNLITQNVFIANVVQGQAEKSSNNQINENYWENHIGLDTTGDNKSNLPYEIDPFFLNLTNEYPPFQLLFESPGMIFIDELFITPSEDKMIDQSPLMVNVLTERSVVEQNNLFVILISIGLLLFSTTIILTGVKKNEKKC